MFMLTQYSKGKVLDRLSSIAFWDDMLHSVALRTIKFMDFYGMRGFESSEYIGANYDNYYMEKQISMFSPDFQITCNLACDAFSTYGNRRFGLYVSERVPVREANGLVNIRD